MVFLLVYLRLRISLNIVINYFIDLCLLRWIFRFYYILLDICNENYIYFYYICYIFCCMFVFMKNIFLYVIKEYIFLYKLNLYLCMYMVNVKERYIEFFYEF